MVNLVILLMNLVLTDHFICSSTYYIGTKCQQNSVLHLNEGDELHFILQEKVHCIWERGVFRNEVLEPSGNFTNKKKCKTYANAVFKRGRWKGDCEVPWLSSFQMRSALQNKTISFYGDSLVRQIFLRLIWHLRGESIIIEHGFHKDAFYAFNATHDYFLLGTTYNPSSDIISPLFIANFNWDTVIQYAFTNPTFLPENLLLVVGYHYWGHDALFMKNVPRLLKWKNSTLFMTTPSRQANSTAPHDDYLFRNSWIRENTFFLPLSEMADTSIFQRNKEDNMHYQCSFLTTVEERVTSSFKAPPSGDCRDMINLNNVMILVHFAQRLRERD